MEARSGESNCRPAESREGFREEAGFGPGQEGGQIQSTGEACPPGGTRDMGRDHGRSECSWPITPSRKKGFKPQRLLSLSHHQRRQPEAGRLVQSQSFVSWKWGPWCLFCWFFLKFIYFEREREREREREHKRGRGRDRGGEKPKQLPAVSTDSTRGSHTTVSS